MSELVVQRASGTWMNDDAARLAVAALDELFRLSQRQGGVPAAAVVELRNSLYAAVIRGDRPAADVELLAPDVVLELDAAAVVDTTTAARVLGLKTEAGVRYLREKGDLDGELRGGRWWITSVSLQKCVRERAARG